MKSLSLIAIITFLANLASAYIDQGKNQAINAGSILEQAKQESLGIKLGISPQEERIKNEIQQKKFEVDPLASDPRVLGLKREIDQGNELKKVEKAKVIARSTIAKAIQERWNKEGHNLRFTILNVGNAVSFAEYRTDLEKTLENSTFFVGTKWVGSKRTYVFYISDWAKVRVSDDLKSVDWLINFDSHMAGNKIESVAVDLKAEESPSAPSAAEKSRFSF